MHKTHIRATKHILISFILWDVLSVSLYYLVNRWSLEKRPRTVLMGQNLDKVLLYNKLCFTPKHDSAPLEQDHAVILVVGVWSLVVVYNDSKQFL